jgi:hypothetical protein
MIDTVPFIKENIRLRRECLDFIIVFDVRPFGRIRRISIVTTVDVRYCSACFGGAVVETCSPSALLRAFKIRVILADCRLLSEWWALSTGGNG